ncbi:hypothetical protein Ddye_008019 [Dipteronia dyeriana]|uniref:Small auxin up regulated protein n=1 Tax=Dipteronia dyeriana TaxID=168575 RepID=A0AAD9X913_9ROSI|nr:hypothetical protein Ddye_008019 [Dipteronia dyeriana]
MRGNIVILRLIKKTLTRILLTITKGYTFVATAPDTAAAAANDYDDLGPLPEDLPEDVKEGHFVVHAIDDGELKRFVIGLDYLAHPRFTKLLELAEEEFGFQQAGVLAIPRRRSNELQRILENLN